MNRRSKEECQVYVTKLEEYYLSRTEHMTDGQLHNVNVKINRAVEMFSKGFSKQQIQQTMNQMEQDPEGTTKKQLIEITTDEVQTKMLQEGFLKGSVQFNNEFDVRILTAIKRYITRIEELVDMDQKELIIQDIIAKEEEIKHLKEVLHEKKEIIEKLGKELNNIEEEIIEGDKKIITKELNDLDLECANLNRDIEKKDIEIEQLKEKIGKIK